LILIFDEFYSTAPWKRPFDLNLRVTKMYIINAARVLNVEHI